MKRLVLVAAMLSFSVGCGVLGGEGKDSGSSSGDDDDDDDDGNGDECLAVDFDAEFARLIEGLPKNDCANTDTAVVPEAAVVANSYFVGVFARADGLWTGKEYWVQYPDAELAETNDWKDVGDDGCLMVWDAEAEEDPETLAGACALCDYGVDVGAAFNEGESTCHQNFIDVEGVDYVVTYEVEEASDGASTFTYPSGTDLGEGTWDECMVTYVSELNCKIY